jgi:hypothetical protein
MAKVNLKDLDIDTLRKIKRNNILTIFMGTVLAVYFLWRFLSSSEITSHFLIGSIVCALVTLIVIYRTMIVVKEIRSRE